MNIKQENSDCSKIRSATSSSGKTKLFTQKKKNTSFQSQSNIKENKSNKGQKPNLHKYTILMATVTTILFLILFKWYKLGWTGLPVSASYIYHLLHPAGVWHDVQVWCYKPMRCQNYIILLIQPYSNSLYSKGPIFECRQAGLEK